MYLLKLISNLKYKFDKRILFFKRLALVFIFYLRGKYSDKNIFFILFTDDIYI